MAGALWQRLMLGGVGSAIGAGAALLIEPALMQRAVTLLQEIILPGFLALLYSPFLCA